MLNSYTHSTLLYESLSTTNYIQQHKEKHIFDYDLTYTKKENTLSPISSNLPNEEIQFLKDLYFETNGEYWQWQDESISGKKWNFTSDVNNNDQCLWQGVSCTCDNRTEYHKYIDEAVELPYGYGYLYYVYYSQDDADIKDNNCYIDKLFLISYNISGSIPLSLGNLKHLTHLHLVDNHFTNSIPSTIVKLSDLSVLVLSVNQLNNSIPSDISLLKNLTIIDLGFNNLSGVIPDLSGFDKVKKLFLSFNALLEGSIPDSIGYMTSLQRIGLANSLNLKGSIPTSIGLLSNLFLVVIQNTSITGSIPSEMGDCSSLVVFACGYNKFSNAIPSELGKLVNLEVFRVQNSFISSSLPSELMMLPNLINFNVSVNLLAGSIPLITSDYLVYFDISYNSFSGNFANKIKSPNLKVLLLSHNKFVENLYNLIDSNNSDSLENIDIGNNYFTGSLPSNIFEVPSLSSFSAVGNCIEGNIPIEICSSTTLLALALDGIDSSPHCTKRIFPFSTAYLSNINVIPDGIPTCIFSMNSLQLLHVCGNGIHQELPHDLIIGSNLQDLALSNNLFEGPIPNTIQLKTNWINLDLSYNKFNGEILSSFPALQSDANLDLQSNRLSGYVPKSLIYAKNINIITGNRMTCSNEYILPLYDKETSSYQCGSKNYALSLLLLLLSLGILLIYKSRLWDLWKRNQLSFQIKSIFNYGKFRINRNYDILILITNSTSSFNIPHLLYLKEISHVIWKLLGYNVLFNTFILMPLGYYFNLYFFTFEYEYDFKATFLFLSGMTPGIFIYVLITIISIILFIYLKRNIPLSNQFKKNKELDEFKIRRNRYIEYTIIFIVNTIIISIVNIIYIMSYQKFNGITIFFLQFGLAIVKGNWNIYLLSLLIKKIKINKLYKKKHSKYDVIFHSCLGVFNSILIPMFFSAGLNPNCFYHIFKPQAAKNPSYMYNVCVTFSVDSSSCLQYQTFQRFTSYLPPFSYSYNCSSSLTTYYAPFFVYMSIGLVIYETLFFWLVKLLYQYCPVHIIDILDRYVPIRMKTSLIIKKAKNELQKVVLNDADFASFKKSENSIQILRNSLPNLSDFDNSNIENLNRISVSKNYWDRMNSMVEDEKFQQKNNIVFKKDFFIVNLVTFLSLIFTIGLAVPILGIILSLCLSIYIHTSLSSIGRLLLQVNDDEDQKQLYFDLIEKDLHRLPRSMDRCGFIFYYVIGIFWGAYILDTLGDEPGYIRSISYPLAALMIFNPLIMWITKELLRFFFPSLKKRIYIGNTDIILLSPTEKVINEKSLELNEIQKNPIQNLI